MSLKLIDLKGEIDKSTIISTRLNAKTNPHSMQILTQTNTLTKNPNTNLTLALPVPLYITFTLTLTQVLTLNLFLALLLNLEGSPELSPLT
jgi:hypothetical protein